MIGSALERVFRSAGGRIIGALAARFRDLSLAEDAFSESCMSALRVWPQKGLPDDPAAWLYRAAERAALNELRRNRVRERCAEDVALAEAETKTFPELEAGSIPDERLRLIFLCCHPALALESRAALTLRLVCGLTVGEIARAFLVQELTVAQRLVRAKRKIVEAGVPFELPSRSAWPERLQAVYCVLEIVYAKAHEDAAGTGTHAGFAAEVLHLSALLTQLLPADGEAFALAAQVHYAEARRAARTDGGGMMVPLSEQDPARWDQGLITRGDLFLSEAVRLAPATPRTLKARLQQAWCARREMREPAPWARVLELYNALLAMGDDPIVRLNHAVALAEVEGAGAALRAVENLPAELHGYLPYHAVRADLLRRVGQLQEAKDAYADAMALEPPLAERRWLEGKMAQLDLRRRPGKLSFEIHGRGY